MDKIAWSYSRLTMFESCPQLFLQTHLKKTIKFVENAAMKRGSEVHKQLERNVARAMSGMPGVGEDVIHVQPIIDGFVAGHADVRVEEELTLTSELNKTTWFAKDAHIRAKLDLVGIANPLSKLQDWRVSTLDWKTGQVRDEPSQLKLYNMVVMLVWPLTQTVTSAFVFVDHKVCSPPVTSTRLELHHLIDEFCDRAEAIQIAAEKDHWPAIKNFRCKWCSVNTCQYVGMR